MLPEIVDDEEWLYRYIPNSPIMSKYDNEGNFVRFTSAALKDSLGLSVDRDGKRNEEEIIEALLNFDNRDEDGGILKVQTGDCRKKDAEVKSAPTESNIYHAEIVRRIKNKEENKNASTDKVELTRSTIKFILNKATIVKKTNP